VKASAIDLRGGLEPLQGLVAGTAVLLSGPLIAMRDAAHTRLQSLLALGGTPPFDLTGRIVYYMSPALGFGRPVSSAGPTTSARMDPWLGMLLDLGTAATLGKGPRSPSAASLCRDRKAPYLAAAGGAGALYAVRVASAGILAWPDLGPEAVMLLEVQDFPAFVGIDTEGRTMFAPGRSG